MIATVLQSFSEHPVRFTAAIVSLGLAIDAVESFSMKREFAHGGLYSWCNLRSTHRRLLRSPWKQMSELACCYRSYMGLLVIQLICALAVIVNPAGPISTVALFAMLVLKLASYFRNRYGIDSADQMLVIVLAGSVAYRCVSAPWAKEAALWFICLQALVAYLTAAWKAVPKFTGRARAIVMLLSGLPLLVFAGPAACAVFLACALALHLLAAVRLGWNNFVWPFVACYPIVLSCAIACSSYFRTLHAVKLEWAPLLNTLL